MSGFEKHKLLVKKFPNGFTVSRCELDGSEEDCIAFCSTLEKAKLVMEALSHYAR